MIKSKVMPVAYGTDVRAWENLVTGPEIKVMGNAERMSFGCCMKAAMEIASNDEGVISVVMDQGRVRQGNELMYHGARDLYPDGVLSAPLSHLPVTGTPALQAADIAAHYFYVYAQDWMKDRNAPLHPHFAHLVNNSEQLHYGMFTKDDILPIVNRLRGRISGGPSQ